MVFAYRKVLMTLAKSFQGDTRPRLEAQALRRGGYDVEVLAWDRDMKMPFRSNIDGTNTTSVKVFRGVAFGKLRFALASIIFQTMCFFYALRLARTGRLTVHAHDFNTLLPGALIKLVLQHRVGLVYDCHEYTPGVYAEWYGVLAGRVASILEQIFGRYADAVITVSDPIANCLKQTLGKTCTVIWNCPPLRQMSAISKETARAKLNLPAGFLILCIGLFRQDLAYETLLELRNRAKAYGLNDVRAVLVGKGLSEKFLAEVRASPGFFVVREWVEQETALLYYRACDLTFCMYRAEGANSRVGMPWKFFESVLCGTPVIVTLGSYLYVFVRKYACGVGADPRSAKDVAQAVARIRNSKARLLDGFASEFGKAYSWEKMEERLLSLYAGLEEGKYV